MIFSDLFKSGVKMANANAPALLTAFGAVGTVTTAVLTARATFQAAERIREAQIEKNLEGAGPFNPLTKTEQVKLVWPLYIGAVSSGVLSCGSIIMAHRVSSRRAAALAAAYALSEGRLEEYQDKVKEKFGVKKEKEARDEIAADKVQEIGDAGFHFANPLSGKVWIMEAYTGRPFLSTVENVKRAVNEINHRVQSDGSARLSDFYDVLNEIDPVANLDHVSTSDRFGWTREDLMSIDWATTTSPDGNLAVHVFEYVGGPIMDPEREARSFR